MALPEQRVQQNRMSIANSILLMCEQFDVAIPRPHKADYYISPVINWMTAEWETIKLLLANNIVAIAMEEEVPKTLTEAKAEQIVFPVGRQNKMFQQMSAIMKKYKVDTNNHIDSALRLAKSDAVPKLVAGTENVTTVRLSKEAMQRVVDGLQFQKDFVDDFTITTRKRVKRLLKGRYGDVSSFRSQVNREFRIDRSRALTKFHATVKKHAESVMAGRITPATFQSKMEKSIGIHYNKMYREGKGSPLEVWEKEFVKKQVETQSQYLDNFRTYIEQKTALGEELTSRITQRASLYAERGSALFEAGQVSAFPDDVLIDWTLQPAEHCRTCPILAANSPYTKGHLPGYPGEGFHLTQCGTNCKCILTVSDLYVTRFPKI